MISKYRILSLFLLVLSFASCHVAKDEFASRMLFGEHWSILGMVLVAVFTGLAYLLATFLAKEVYPVQRAGKHYQEIEETRYGTRTYKDNWGLPTHTVDFEETVGTGEYESYVVTKEQEQWSIEKNMQNVQVGRTCACLLSVAFLILTNGLQGTEINGAFVLTGLILGIAVIIFYIYGIATTDINSPIVIALSSDVAKYLRYSYIFGFALFFVCVCIGDTGFAAIGNGIVFFIKTIFGIGYVVATLLNLVFELSDSAFTAITILVTIPSVVGLYKVLYQWISKLYQKAEKSDKTSIIITTCTFLLLICFFCYLPCSILLD